VRKWAASQRTERAAAQEHFIDICRMLDMETPNEADPTGDFYAFEKGAQKTTGDDGFADVWLRGHFAWEYKGKRKDLNTAYQQLLNYHEALEQPPLLVVCDLERFEVHTKWTNTESWVYRFTLLDIDSDEPVEVRTNVGPAKDAPKIRAVDVLRALFQEPERLKPNRTTDQITKDAAALFGTIASQLRKWKDGRTGEQLVDDMRIARFITRLLFCLFATDVGLLPKSAFSELIRAERNDPKAFREGLRELFRVMKTGGRFGPRTLPHFNGSLFDDDDVPEELTGTEIRILEKLDRLNWTDVEPAIFGTLFERVLDPRVRAKLGAHYTSREDIETLVEPVLMQPLRREWVEVRERAIEAMLRSKERGGSEDTQREKLRAEVEPFLKKLGSIRVLDPACGSGNFLYVSLALLKGLEKEVLGFSELHGVRFEPVVHPRQLYGIETNPYAHELASIVIWIGYLQWKYRNGLDLAAETPILQPLRQIELKDAILDLSDPAKPREPEWPEVDVIVGNPPFLGGKRLRTELGDAYVDALFAAWDGRVRREADLCCYWFEKARAAIERGAAKRAGLLATQAIRGGANRETLKRIKESGDIFFAHSDRPWVLDGAAVRVSMVGFDDGSETRRELNGRPVEGINANLTAHIDLTKVKRLPENAGIAFMGDTKVGPFEIDEATAKQMLASPNPHGKPNSDVVRPWVNGSDVTGRPRNMWIIDFPPGTSVEEAALYEEPFKYLEKYVKPERLAARTAKSQDEVWWVHHRPRPDMRGALLGLPRFVVTPRVSKHRLFLWVSANTLPDSAVIAFARDDDYFFGVLHSRPHELWARAQGTQLREAESGFRYTPTTTFETFPLPWPPGEEPWGDPLVEAIAEAARELDELRNRWLNPAPVDGHPWPESELKKRTLTNLYNERPTWLRNAHRKLDEAVFAAYGWDPGLSDEEVLAKLLALNLERAGQKETEPQVR